MMREYTEEEILNMKVSNYVKQFENAKEQQLTELIIEILVESIMKEYHEESNQILRFSNIGQSNGSIEAQKLCTDQWISFNNGS
ncbi:hypothetical protein [Flavobacterium yafengii]|uniref:hypothetical protein n=1 Tax=Flavobacterium yafengii TaxID=3041253 RepID=UPI0024A8C0E0|nr:hypothetical protein [Flavobacterium yafengii]MDI5887667.1 hypothetical protein [Flavobacterium yafengii]